MDEDEKASQDKEDETREEPESGKTPDVNGVEQDGGEDKEEEGETKVNGEDQEKTKEEEEGDEDHTENTNMSDVVLRREVRTVAQIGTAVCCCSLGWWQCSIFIFHMSERQLGASTN